MTEYNRTLKRREPTNDELSSAAWLQQRVNEGLTPTQIARDVGCQASTVRNWLLFHGMENAVSSQTQTSCELSESYLRECVYDEQMTSREIADDFGCFYNRVKKWAIRYGIDHYVVKTQVSDTQSRDYGDLATATWAQTGCAWREEDQLYRAYWQYYWSSGEIAKWASGSPAPATLRRQMKQHDIPLRSNSESKRVKAMKQRGASLSRIRHEVPPPDSSDATEASTVSVDWSQLASDD
jgi:hypothetical protein